MKFKLVKEVDGEVRGYDGEMISTGDEVELNDWLSSKAAKNPDYEEVKAPAKKAPAKKVND